MIEKCEITQNYLRIIASPDTGESLYLYYSPISEKREDAFLLNSGNEEISLYINKAFTKLEADGTIFLTIACFTSKCSFQFSILEINEIDLSRDGQYTYFTTDKKIQKILSKSLELMHKKMRANILGDRIQRYSNEC